jgi:hypothetical protein
VWFRIIRFVMWPWWRISGALELRRLHRAHPNAHRRLISSREGIGRESDDEYLDRLRAIHVERYEDQK